MIVDTSPWKPELDELARSGRPERFLDRIARLVSEFITNPRFFAHTLFLPALDAMLRETGLARAQARFASGRQTSRNLVVHVASELYAVGGHTRVIEDVIRALPEFRHSVVVTDLFGRFADGSIGAAAGGGTSLAGVRDRFSAAGAELVLLRPDSLVGKVNQLQSVLLAETPRACYVATHAPDVVAATALNELTSPHIVFLHHSDHLPSLGAARADYRHADLTPTCHELCLAHAGRGPAAPVYLGLTARDRGIRALQDPLDRPMGALSVGTWGKFAGAMAGLRYVDLVREVIRSAGGPFCHAGGIPSDALQALRSELAGAGLDPGLFVDLGIVPSVWDALSRLDVHFYVNSFPAGGGLTIAEALGAGIPILRGAVPGGPKLFQVDMTLGAGVPWRSLREIGPAVARMRKEWRALAERSRATYEQHYSPARFRQKLLDLMQ